MTCVLPTTADQSCICCFPLLTASLPLAPGEKQTASRRISKNTCRVSPMRWRLALSLSFSKRYPFAQYQWSEWLSVRSQQHWFLKTKQINYKKMKIFISSKQLKFIALNHRITKSKALNSAGQLRQEVQLWWAQWGFSFDSMGWSTQQRSLYSMAYMQSSCDLPFRETCDSLSGRYSHLNINQSSDRTVSTSWGWSKMQDNLWCQRKMTCVIFPNIYS